MALLLRVYVNPNQIRKIKLSTSPESVQHLQDELKANLGLTEDFAIQYEDPDFDNALCNLIDISELPTERAVLHLVWSDNESASRPDTPLPQTPSDSGSISSLDTTSLHSSDVPYSPSSIIRNYMRSTSQWPQPFPIPSFSYDVELKLAKANEVYEKTGAGLDVTRGIKMEILDKLAQQIFTFKAYPEKNEIASVASELVVKFPCLKEPGGGTGYAGWDASIKFKLANYQRERCLLVDELKKRGKDMALIRQKMELTFSLRRKEIVEMQPLVKEVQQRWPALFSEQQVSDVVQHRRTICLEGLPVFVRDTASKLFVTCLDTDPLERSIQGVKVGILVVLEDYTGHATEHTVVNIAVVLEEDGQTLTCLFSQDVSLLSGRVSSLRTCLFSQDVSLLSGRVSSLRTCLFSQDVSLLFDTCRADRPLLLLMSDE
ncbi:hypothetical protein WMY93_021000 [Mugilogobius chulae]|uniref:PB1 domain-containing protein n=1 Tax=Mugilogobius chulae TaxID=88201 RepID=A0AAW0NCN0_9GOBI